MGALFLMLIAATPCPAKGAAVVVLTAEHTLVTCADGAELTRAPIALGSGGVAGKRVGWAQTPLGRFTLSAPRPSSQFHTFIPLVNPDPRRFSAWAIGLHGPPRDTKDAGLINVESDWTWGCIALASDEAIDALAAWVRAARVTHVEFR